MPWGDWQFWLVTGLALAGIWLVVRPLLPSRRADADCCGRPRAPRKQVRTRLTVSGTTSPPPGDQNRR